MSSTRLIEHLSRPRKGAYIQMEKKTLEQIEREMQRKVDFDKWSIEKNRDFIATPFKHKEEDGN